VSTLGTIGAVLGATAGLDGNQLACLNAIWLMECAMESLRTIEQFRKWSFVNGLHFALLPVVSQRASAHFPVHTFFSPGITPLDHYFVAFHTIISKSSQTIALNRLKICKILAPLTSISSTACMPNGLTGH
jgi:hypothetical protein